MESYEGRLLGIRYRGQQKGIAMLHRPDRPSLSALANSSNWADPPATSFDDHLQQQEEEEMQLSAADKEVGGAAKVPQAQLPPKPPTQHQERQRKKSGSKSDSERSRSPHKDHLADRRPPCAHPCPDCASSFATSSLYTNHLHTAHPDETKLISEAWLSLKARDPTAYASLRGAATCDLCQGFYPHRLPPPID